MRSLIAVGRSCTPAVAGGQIFPSVTGLHPPHDGIGCMPPPIYQPILPLKAAVPLVEGNASVRSLHLSSLQPPSF